MYIPLGIPLDVPFKGPLSLSEAAMAKSLDARLAQHLLGEEPQSFKVPGKICGRESITLGFGIRVYGLGHLAARRLEVTSRNGTLTRGRGGRHFLRRHISRDSCPTNIGVFVCSSHPLLTQASAQLYFFSIFMLMH